jgi:hypothetical protein
MRRVDEQTRPAPGQLWLSCPPYLLPAHVVDVNEGSSPARISYELVDGHGSVLHGPVEAALDEGWWQTFQPLVRRFG